MASNKKCSCTCRVLSELETGELVAIVLSGSSYRTIGTFISYDPVCNTVTISALNGGGILSFDCSRVSVIQLSPIACSVLSCLWVEDPANPVYDPPNTPSAYYETVRYDAAAFSGNGPAAYYKMWYDTGTTPSIGLATSPDGKAWTFNSFMSGLVSTARHSRILYDPNGFGIGAPYRMWYWDSTTSVFSACAAGPANSVCLIRTANSVDGINWTSDQRIFQDPANPLFLATGEAYGSFGPADILYYPNNPAVLDIANPFNNRYVMYYSIVTQLTPPFIANFEQIALAVSTDGITWSSYGFVPLVGPRVILPHGAPTDWDFRYSSVGAVVVQLAPDNFKMWYSGGTFQSQEGIGCASSTDGINWTKYAGNPIFSVNNGVPWRNLRTYNPWVLIDPQRFSGHGDAVCSKFWFTGQSAALGLTIGYALNANEDSPV